MIGTVPLGTGAQSISASADGRLVAIGSMEGPVQVFEASALLDGALEDVQPPVEIAAAPGTIFNSLSPDGSTLATGGFDGRLYLWDVATGELDGRIDLDSIISDATFTPDGSEVLVALDHGIVQRVTLDVEELVSLGLARAGRTMTETECRQYLDVNRCPD